MKNKALILGAMSAVSPVPGFIFTLFWDWTWAFGIGMGLLGYDVVPFWITVVGVLPLLISPLAGLFGIVYGIVRRREEKTWLGILLSVLCVVENVLMIYGICYLAIRF